MSCPADSLSLSFLVVHSTRIPSGTALHQSSPWVVSRALTILSKRMTSILFINSPGSTSPCSPASATRITKWKGDVGVTVHRSPDTIPNRRLPRLHRMMLNDALHMPRPEGAPAYMSAQMVLALLKDPFPWIYDTGSETLQILRSRKPAREKRAALTHFDQILRRTAEDPSTRRTFGDEAELNDVFHMLFDMIHNTHQERR